MKKNDLKIATGTSFCLRVFSISFVVLAFIKKQVYELNLFKKIFAKLKLEVFKKRSLLILILFLSFSVRLWKIDQIPQGFFCDEASIGYNAYSLLNTGKDEWQNSWPLFFKAFGEYKNPILIYSTIPFVAVFGLNEFSVRLPSVLFGVLTVLAVYFLTQKAFNRKTALWAALFLSISPWHIHISRISLEGLSPFLFFTTAGLYFWLKEKRIISVLLFSLAFYSYFTARIFIPLLAVFIIVFDFKKLTENLKKTLLISLVCLITTMPILLHMILGPGLARWQQVKADYPASTLIERYADHFSIKFLFSKGDIDFPGQFITRHSIRGIGELYWFQLPILLIGFYYLLKKRKRFESKVILSWLFLYPLTDIFTQAVGPQATRSIIGIIPLQIISALGFVLLTKKIKARKIFAFSIVFLTIISFGHFLKLLNNYPLYSADFWGWQYGPREIIGYFKKASNNYDELIMAGNFNSPEIFLKFYDPGKICKNCKIGGLDSFDADKKQLFALTSKETLEFKKRANIEVKEIINYPNGKIAFVIFKPLF